VGKAGAGWATGGAGAGSGDAEVCGGGGEGEGEGVFAMNCAAASRFRALRYNLDALGAEVR